LFSGLPQLFLGFEILDGSSSPPLSKQSNQYHVGPVFHYLAHSLPTIGRFTNHLDHGPRFIVTASPERKRGFQPNGAQQRPQTAPGSGIIIGDQNPNGFGHGIPFLLLVSQAICFYHPRWVNV
jgi:hypothetical protein